MPHNVRAVERVQGTLDRQNRSDNTRGTAAASRAGSAPAQILALQRAVGNQAAVALVQRQFSAEKDAKLEKSLQTIASGARTLLRNSAMTREALWGPQVGEILVGWDEGLRQRSAITTSLETATETLQKQWDDATVEGFAEVADAIKAQQRKVHTAIKAAIEWMDQSGSGPDPLSKRAVDAVKAGREKAAAEGKHQQNVAASRAGSERAQLEKQERVTRQVNAVFDHANARLAAYQTQNLNRGAWHGTNTHGRDVGYQPVSADLLLLIKAEAERRGGGWQWFGSISSGGVAMHHDVSGKLSLIYHL